MSDVVDALVPDDENAPLGAPPGEQSNLLDRYRAGEDLAQHEYRQLSRDLSAGETAGTLSVTDDEKQDILDKAAEAATFSESDITTEPIEEEQAWLPTPED